MRDKALNQKDTLSSSFIKILLKDTLIRKRKISEQSPQNPCIEDLKKLKSCNKEPIIGLSNSGNNCCINATLQIILNNLELRKIWENCFPEIAVMYYEALYNGQASAPEAISYEFRRQLIQKSSSNLINEDSDVQEDPTAFFEVFFNICKENLSHMEVSFERMKYKQVGDGSLEPSIEKPENHREFRISINNQFDRNISLEELLKNHCLEINEVEENGIKITYRSEDQYVSLPYHLFIDLFTNDRRNTSGVCIPTNLFFPRELLRDKCFPHEYELKGFIVHLGETDVRGHYIAYRKVHEKWMEFNDDLVVDVDENQLQELLENSQKEESSSLPHILEGCNPYICMLSYSKKQP